MGKIFKHNEKTDFIVNMKESTYRSLVFGFLLLFVIALTASYLPYFFAKGNTIDYQGADLMTGTISYSMSSGDALEKLKIPMIALMAFGFFGFLLLLIAGVKKFLTLRQSMPLILLAVYGGLCTVSTFFAYDINIAFFGNQGRYEGLLTIIACIGIFAAAVQLERTRLRTLLCDIVVIVAAVNCFVGVMQAIPATSRYIPGFFSEANFLDIISIDHLIANGIIGSPYALCSYAVIGLGICLAGIMYCDSVKKRVFYIICGAVCLCGGLFTKLMAVIVGTAVIFICGSVIEIARIKTGHGLIMKGFFKNPIGKLICAFVLSAVVFAVFRAFDYYGFYESYIASTDSLSRLMVSNPRYDSDGIGFFSSSWKDGFSMLKDNWIFGTGPDCIGLERYGAQSMISEAGSTDRIYNEYLNIALSTGIPSLVCYLGFIVLSCKRGIEGLGRFFSRKEGYERAGVFIACAGYCAAACFSISTPASLPIFFLMAGLAVSSDKSKPDT